MVPPVELLEAPQEAQQQEESLVARAKRAREQMRADSAASAGGSLVERARAARAAMQQPVPAIAAPPVPAPVVAPPRTDTVAPQDIAPPVVAPPVSPEIRALGEQALQPQTTPYQPFQMKAPVPGEATPTEPTPGAKVAAAMHEKTFGRAPLQVATTPAEAPDAARLRTDQGEFKFQKIADRGDSTDVMMLEGPAAGRTITVPTNTIQQPMREAQVTVGRPAQGIEQQLPYMSKAELTNIKNNGSLQDRIAVTLGMARQLPEGIKTDQPKLTWNELVGHTVMNGLANAIPGAGSMLDDADMEEKLSRFGMEGNSLEEWQINTLAALHSASSVLGVSAAGQAFGGGAEIGRTSGAQAAAQRLGMKGATQPMRAGAEKAIADIAAENNIQPSVLRARWESIARGASARAPQLAEAAKQGVIQGAAGGVTTGAGMYAAGARDPNDIAKEMGKAALTYGLLGGSFEALSAEAQFNAGYKIMKAGIEKAAITTRTVKPVPGGELVTEKSTKLNLAERLRDKKVNEMKASGTGEPGEEFGASGELVSTRKPKAPAAPPPKPKPTAPVPKGAPLEGDLETLAGYAVDALTPGKANQLDVDNALATIEQLPDAQKSLVRDRISQLAKERVQGTTSAPAPAPVKTPAAPPAAAPVAEAEAPKGPLTKLRGKIADALAPEAKQEREQLRAERDEARRATEVSPLTGLGSKVALERAKAAVDADPSLAWVVADGKRFKEVNDTFGHSVGDEALKHFGKAMELVADEMGIPKRLFHQGGDEFAAAVPKDRATEFAAKLAKASNWSRDNVTSFLHANSGDTFDDADKQTLARKRKSRVGPPPVAEAPAEPKPSKIAEAMKPSAPATNLTPEQERIVKANWYYKGGEAKLAKIPPEKLPAIADLLLKQQRRYEAQSDDRASDLETDPVRWEENVTGNHELSAQLAELTGEPSQFEPDRPTEETLRQVWSTRSVTKLNNDLDKLRTRVSESNDRHEQEVLGRHIVAIEHNLKAKGKPAKPAVVLPPHMSDAEQQKRVDAYHKAYKDYVDDATRGRTPQNPMGPPFDPDAPNYQGFLHDAEKAHAEAMKEHPERQDLRRARGEIYYPDAITAIQRDLRVTKKRATEIAKEMWPVSQGSGPSELENRLPSNALHKFVSEVAMDAVIQKHKHGGRTSGRDAIKAASTTAPKKPGRKDDRIAAHISELRDRSDEELDKLRAAAIAESDNAPGTIPEIVQAIDNIQLDRREAPAGATDAEVKEVAAAFSEALASEGKITHVFDPPKKREVVRLQDKVKVYVAEHGWMTVAEANARIDDWAAHAAAQRKGNPNGDRVVLSLFDLTGQWSQPWVDAGYQVYRFDIQDDWFYEEENEETGEIEQKRAGDVTNFSTQFFADMFGAFDGNDVHAVLAACPCTDFAVSGARHFAAKDADGRTVESVKLVDMTQAVVEFFKPAVWAIENPVGRIEKLTGLPPWRASFDPNHFGDPYTKKTLLWGRFNGDMPIAPVEPTEGSKMHQQFGGSSQRTKNARSVTPEGFAYAFFMANNAVDHPAMAIHGKYDRLDRKVIEDAVRRGVTEEQISEAVDDFYYMEMDDASANEAIRELSAPKSAPKKEAEAPKRMGATAKREQQYDKDDVAEAAQSLRYWHLQAKTQAALDDAAIATGKTDGRGKKLKKAELEEVKRRVAARAGTTDSMYARSLDSARAEFGDAIADRLDGEIRGTIPLSPEHAAILEEWRKLKRIDVYGDKYDDVDADDEDYDAQAHHDAELALVERAVEAGLIARDTGNEFGWMREEKALEDAAETYTPAKRKAAATPKPNVTTFNSGANEPADIRGFADGGHHVGANLAHIAEPGIKELEALADKKDVSVFVDSGAFSEFRGAGKPITDELWRKRIAVLDRLSKVLGKRLHFVAPDKVGDQEGTLQRLETYKDLIAPIAERSDMLVAMQLGEMAPANFYDEVVRVLGHSDFRPALPFNEVPMSIKEAADFVERTGVDKVHLLGIGVKRRDVDFNALVTALTDARPGIEISHDSSTLRAKVGTDNGPGGGPRKVTEEQIRAQAEGHDRFTGETTGEFGEHADYTEDIAAPSGWRDAKQLVAIAEAAGLTGARKAAFLKDPDGFLQTPVPTPKRLGKQADPIKWVEEPGMAEALDQAWKEHLDATMKNTRRAVAVRTAFPPKPTTTGMVINPDSVYADEENPEALYLGSISQARGHFNVARAAKATLARGTAAGTNRKLTEKQITTGQREASQAIALYERTLGGIADAFGTAIADVVRTEIEGTGKRYIPMGVSVAEAVAIPNLTTADTPMAKAAREYSDPDKPRTIADKSAARLAFQEKTADSEELRVFGEARKKYGKVGRKTVAMVWGLPASGKTRNAVDPLADFYHLPISDVDDIKPKIDENEQGWGSSLVYAEAGLIAKNYRTKLQEAGVGYVQPGLGADFEGSLKELDRLHKADFKVHLVHVRVSVAEAQRRAVKRFEEGGIWIDPAYIAKIGKQTRETYEALKTHPAVASYAEIDHEALGGAYVIDASPTADWIGASGLPRVVGRGPAEPSVERRNTGEVDDGPDEPTAGARRLGGRPPDDTPVRGPAHQVDEGEPAEAVPAPRRLGGTGRAGVGSRPDSDRDVERDGGTGARGSEPGDVVAGEGGHPERGADDRDRGRDAGSRLGTGRGDRESETGGRLPVEPPPVTPETATAPRAVPPKQTAVDFRITEDTKLAAGGPTERIRANLAAIKLVRTLAAEARTATPEEQKVLARYVGWGGLSKIFDEHSDTAGKYAAQRDELRSVLSEAEYAAARKSTRNAHYTSPDVIRAIYTALLHFGVSGEHGPLKMLEPAAGIGHFLGLLPPELKAAWTAIELDPTTAAISKALYPSADTMNMGFQNAKLADNSFDVVIGNPPFGDSQLAEARYDKMKLLMHDHFFVKSLDKLRPGGVLAFVTSQGTMDKVNSKARDEMAARGDFIGGIRLPNTAFKENAGTQVTTDILFFRKRVPGQTAKLNQPFLETRGVPALLESGAMGQATVNEYFAANPDKVLGTHALTGGMHREHDYTVNPRPDAKEGPALNAAIEAAIKHMPESIYIPADGSSGQQPLTEEQITEVEHAPAGLRRGWLIERNGRMMQVNDEDMLVPAAVPDTQAAKVKALVGLREARQLLTAAQLTDDFNEDTFNDALEIANERYKAFVKKYGPINKEDVTVGTYKSGPNQGKQYRTVKRPNLDAFKRLDPSAPLVASLEDYDVATGKAEPSDYLRTRQLSAPRPLTHVDRIEDALPASLNARGRVDLPYMAKLARKTEDEVADALRGTVIFEDPATGDWETADLYLSGNVRAKLVLATAEAKKDPRRYSPNVTALEAAQPKPLTPSQIYVRIGSPWVPTKDYVAFAQETFRGGVTVQRTEAAGGSWAVSFDEDAKKSAANLSQYGVQTERGRQIVDGERLFEESLNQKSTEIRYTDEDGKSHKDVEATLRAQATQQELRARFQQWVWEDEDRTGRLLDIYNTQVNNSVAPNITGAFLNVPGTATTIRSVPFKWSSWQKDAIWRIVTKGTTLLAHVVGAGKTFTMIAAGMEMRRLGIARKNLYVVPNHLVDQWSTEFLQLYPNANILVATKNDFKKEKRREFTAKMASGDWDAIIMAHSSFEFVGMSAEYQKTYIQQQIDELKAELEAAAADKTDKQIVKKIEGALERLETKLQRLMNSDKKDDLLSFEETGVDQIFVDEAHEFKNLFITSRMRGQGSIGADKSFDLYMKTQYLNSKTPGRGVVFATGTPVSNTMAEVYTMMRYLEPQVLLNLGTQNFDAWAAMFGNVVISSELAPDGSGYRQKDRFAEFLNLPELSTAFRQVGDVRGEEIFPKDPEGERAKRPPIIGGVPKIKTAKASIGLKAVVKTLIARAEKVTKGDVDPSEDNFLKITGEGRKAAMDLRMVSAFAAPDPKGKISMAADQIMADYTASTKHRGTQLVFSDIGTPKKERKSRPVSGQLGDVKAKVKTFDGNRSTSDRYLTDGRLLLDVGALGPKPNKTVATLAKAPPNGATTVDEEQVKKAYDAAVARPNEPGDMLGVAMERARGGKMKKYAIVRGAEQFVALDAEYLALAQKATDFDSIALPLEPMKPVVLMKGDKPVGVLATVSNVNAILLAERIPTPAETKDDAPEGAELVAEAADDDSPDADVKGSLAGYTVYGYLKELLVERGIPADQIAFIHDAKTDLQKKRLFDDVKAGRIRVLMGSTAKMGAGMNVQDRLVSLHHLDAPWRPSDIEQREGRIIRQGNRLWNDGLIDGVNIYRYGTEESFDAYMWQTLERKALFIGAFMRGDPEVRSMEDLDSGSALTMADMKAATSGNPKVKELQDVGAAINRLQLKKRQHQDKASAVSAKIAETASKIRQWEEWKASSEKDEAKLLDMSGDNFAMAIGRTKYTDREKANDALKAVLAKQMKVSPDGMFASGEKVLHTSFGGFDVILQAERGWRLEKDEAGKTQQVVYVEGRLVIEGSGFNYTGGRFTSTDPLSNPVASVEALYRNIKGGVERAALTIADAVKERDDFRSQKLAPFGEADELTKLVERQRELAAELKKTQKEVEEEPIHPEMSKEWWDALNRGEWPYRDIPKPPKQDPGGGVELNSFADPFTAAIKMYKQAAALRRQRKGLPPASPSPLLLGAQNISNAVRVVFAPASLTPEAGQAARIIRAQRGASDLDIERAGNRIEDERAALDELNPGPLFNGPRWQAYRDMEEGRMIPPGPMHDLWQTLRGVQDELAQQIQALGPGHLDNFIVDYMARVYVPLTGSKKRAALSRYGSKRPMMGPKGFKRARKHLGIDDSIAAALAIGMGPPTDNPLDMVLLKHREMRRYLMGQRIKQEMKDAGLIKFSRNTRVPDGYARIDDNAFTVFAPRGAQGEQRIRGYYLAPVDVARVVNNFLSKGLRGNPLYDGYSWLGNTLNMIQLGMSGFHAGFVAFDATVQLAATGLDQVMSGKGGGGRLGGAGKLALAAASAVTGPVTIVPLPAAYMSYRRGAKVMAAYERQTASSIQMEKMIHSIAEAGGRAKMDAYYRAGNIDKMRQAFRDKRWVSMGLRVPFAAIEATMYPLLEHVVPRMKLGAFYQQAEVELARLPAGASTDDVRRALNRAWDAIDARLGQMVYDNLFWHKTTKEMMMAGIRSVGWNVGSVDVTLGAGAQFVGNVVGMGGGGGRGGLPPGAGGGAAGAGGSRRMGGGSGPRDWEKVQYLALLAATAALYGAMYTYLNTGGGPDDWKDYYFPRTGTKDRDGNDERIAPPTYMKDVFAIQREGFGLVGHKVHPLIDYGIETMTNRDFFGDMIHDEDAPFFTQRAQDARHLVKDVLKPFSIRNVEELTRRGIDEPFAQEKVEGFFGNASAPRAIIRTEAQNRMGEILARRGHTSRAPQQKEATEMRRQLGQQYKIEKARRDSLEQMAEAAGTVLDDDALNLPGAVSRDSLSKLVRSGALTAQQSANIKKVAREDPLVTRFKLLSADEAKSVYDLAKPWEKAMWKDAFESKMNRKQRRLGRGDDSLE